jgi:hypothetical protein
MNEFKDLMLGNYDLIWYVAAFVFSFVGLFIRWSLRTRRAIKWNPDSPDKFSWSYWLQNNLWPKLVSVLTTVVIVFVCLRFAGEWFGVVPTMAFALIVGLAFDWFTDYVKKLTKKGSGK